jgi:hypothetical protein
MTWWSGRVKTEWLSNGRKMRLMEAVTFRDAGGCAWTAPAGSLVDGASIPWLLWSVIGPPFTGRYRRASVIHDVYCKSKSHPSSAVHRAFWERMRADGVGRVKAWWMWLAVRLLGFYKTIRDMVRNQALDWAELFWKNRATGQK